jgi:TolB protein
MINADGSGLTPLTNTPGGDFEPAWSPDGEHIAFTSFRDGGMQIYKLHLTDQSVTRLTNLGTGIQARQAAWSPDGDELLFTVARLGTFQVWIMSPNGENARQVVRSGTDYWDYFPAWSHDGSVVIFSQQSAGQGGSVWQMSMPLDQAGGPSAIRMSLGSLPVERARLSPDGFWIAFQGKDEDDNIDIFFLTVSGAERTRLTFDPARDFDPVWRPTRALTAAAPTPAVTSTP